MGLSNIEDILQAGLDGTDIPSPESRIAELLKEWIEQGGNIDDILVAGSNITLTKNSDGTITIAASGEVSSEDTVAREAIAEMKDGTNIDSFGDVETALATKANADNVYKLALSNADLLPANTDLDNIKAVGCYYVYDSVTVVTITNKPTNNTSAFRLTVEFAAGEKRARQIYQEFNSFDKYSRWENSSNVYSAWKKVECDLSAKQNTISDLSTIRSGAALGATAVQPETGKGLSTNDYTTAEKTKLAGIEAQANKTTVDDSLSGSSTNPVQNKVVKSALDSKADTSTTYTKTEVDTALSGKQATLTTAQLAAVNSGMTSEDVEQINTNKNNILTANAELIELVDSGAKNELELITPWGSGITNNPNLTVTLNSDQTITLNGSVTTSGVIVISNTISGKLGKYLFNTTARSKLVAYAQPSWTTVAYDYTGEGGLITDNGNILICLNVTEGETYSNAAIKPMICSKAAWDVSQKFVPYRPTYEETVEQVAENENNISFIDDGARNKLVYDLDLLKSWHTAGTWSGSSYTDTHSLTYTYNSNGTITINGICANGDSMFYLGKNIVLDNVNYILSSGVVLGDNAYLTAKVGSTQTAVTGNDTSKVFVGGTTDVFFYIASGKTFSNFTVYPMCELQGVWNNGLTSYIQGAPSNAELYAMIRALQT